MVQKRVRKSLEHECPKCGKRLAITSTSPKIDTMMKTAIMKHRDEAGHSKVT